jgi:hypothetical protein
MIATLLLVLLIGTERNTMNTHNGPCAERRAYSLHHYGDAEYQCREQSRCRCQCHKEATR